LFTRSKRLISRILLGGTGMCVFQAAGAFELITGRTPDTERMLRHLSRLLAQREAATPA